MRKSVVVGVIATVLALSPAALASENFIPTGSVYASGHTTPPPLGSAEARFQQQVDIYESHIRRERREQQIFESNLRAFETHTLEPFPLLSPDY